MDKYVIVLGGNLPNNGRCNFLSNVDKDGAHFSLNIDDAITFTDRDRCVFLARGLLELHTVDVYSVNEKTTLSFEYIW